MATKTWASATASTWATAASWSPSGVPAAGDDVVFNGTNNGNCTVGAATNALLSLTTVGYTGTLAVNAILTVNSMRGVIVYKVKADTNATFTVTTLEGTTAYPLNFGEKLKVNITILYFQVQHLFKWNKDLATNLCLLGLFQRLKYWAQAKLLFWRNSLFCHY